MTDLVLDAYERRARLTPGLFAIAPLVVLVFALGLDKNVLVTFLLGILTAGSGAYFLSTAAGNLGRRLQDRLWQSWGGTPTVQFLRINSSESNPSQRQIWRTAIENVTGVELLPEQVEREDPSRADDVITAAVDQVRRLTHDSNYPLVARENAQYGFERNLYGARWIGRLGSLTCLVVLFVDLFVFHSTSTTFVVGLIVELVVSVLWFTIPSATRTRQAAFRYSSQLLQAVVQESRGSTP